MLSLEFERGGGDALLRMVLQVANDVIPFDAHRIYLVWTDQSEALWHFPVGFLRDAAFDRDIERARSLDQRLSSNDFFQFVDETSEVPRRQIALFRIKMAHGFGHVALARDNRTGQQAIPTTYKTFSQTEIQQFRAVGSLLSAVVTSNPDDSSARNVLERLYLNFLDRRTLLQELSADEIMVEYLGKALHVLHDLAPESLQSTLSPRIAPTSMLPKIRPTIKLINDNGMALEIAAYNSTSPEEWTAERAKTLYELPDGGGSPTSITAKVFLDRKTFYTNSYDTVPREETKEVFDDTRCHISSPVTAGHGNVIGVFAVETTEPDVYNDILANAFTLLAGHLAWPLRRAIQRTEFTEVEKAFVDDLLTLRTETNIDRLFEALKRPLEALGYPRGVICDVDYNARRVVGKYSWGGSKMDHVRNITSRHFDDNATDCQVRAITKCQRQQIRSPNEDSSVHPDSLSKGELRPFSVYPVLDNHGIPRWTLHVERRDSAPLGDRDDRRISALCHRVMKASEEARRIAFERSFYEHVLRTGFFSRASAH